MHGGTVVGTLSARERPGSDVREVLIRLKRISALAVVSLLGEFLTLARSRRALWVCSLGVERGGRSRVGRKALVRGSREAPSKSHKT